MKTIPLVLPWEVGCKTAPPTV